MWGSDAFLRFAAGIWAFSSVFWSKSDISHPAILLFTTAEMQYCLSMYHVYKATARDGRLIIVYILFTPEQMKCITCITHLLSSQSQVPVGLESLFSTRA